MMQRDGVEWIAKLFEISPELLTPDTRRDAIAAWDSLGVLTLMASLDSGRERVPREPATSLRL